MDDSQPEKVIATSGTFSKILRTLPKFNSDMFGLSEKEFALVHFTNLGKLKKKQLALRESGHDVVWACLGDATAHLFHVGQKLGGEDAFGLHHLRHFGQALGGENVFGPHHLSHFGQELS